MCTRDSSKLYILEKWRSETSIRRHMGVHLALVAADDFTERHREAILGEASPWAHEGIDNQWCKNPLTLLER